MCYQKEIEGVSEGRARVIAKIVEANMGNLASTKVIYELVIREALKIARSIIARYTNAQLKFYEAIDVLVKMSASALLPSGSISTGLERARSFQVHKVDSMEVFMPKCDEDQLMTIVNWHEEFLSFAKYEFAFLGGVGDGGLIPDVAWYHQTQPRHHHRQTD